MARPEAKIQRRLIQFFRDRSWFVQTFHGNIYQSGVPDLYVYQSKFGERWIDVKVKGKYSFTKRQRQQWPIWEKYQVGIWILTDATQEQYDKLFKPPNWRDFWKPVWDEEPKRNDVIDELHKEYDSGRNEP